MAHRESPSQTAGPYVHIGCCPQTAGLERRAMGPELGAGPVGAPADAVTVEIVVLDGANVPVADALVEVWQAGPDGRYTNSAANWGRKASNLSTGIARFQAAKPGRNGDHAPHMLIWVAARGINLALTTRMYFPDEDNAADPVLALAGARAATLIASKTSTGYAHTIRLQGPEETVFFDV